MSARIVSICLVSIFVSAAWAQIQTTPPDLTMDSEDKLFESLAGGIEEDELVQKGFLEEIPDGLNTKDINPQCDPRRFEDSVIGKNLTTSQYFEATKKYFARCQGELTHRSVLGRLGLLKYSKFIYSFLSHPQVSEFLVRLPDGTKVPGILALKKDPRPRPLVIAKCGVFCSAWQTASLKSYLMHLFDQSPFNVLLLANQTGMDYIYHNKRISIGGLTEGYEVLQVGKWMLDKWEYRARISSVHLMGISLGGNAAVLGAVYNDMYPLSSGKKVFNSVAAICPVVSLQPTLENLYRSQIAGRAFAKTTREHFLEAGRYITDVPDMISEDKMPNHRRGFPNFIGELAVASLNRRSVPMDLSGFFKSNNFWNVKAEVQTPMLVWASKDDTVVSNRINAEVFEHDDLYEKSSHVGVLNLRYGDHCGFGTAYGGQASAAVLRTFVLQNSPEFVMSYNAKRTIPWTHGFRKLGPQHEHVGQAWQFYTKNKNVKISFRVFNWSGGDQCYERGPWDSDDVCIQTTEYWVPISALQALGARVPRTEAEAQALTREFNTKVEFRAGNSSLKGTNSREFNMTWRSHFE